MTVVFLHVLASEEVCSGQLAADPESVRTDGVLMPISHTWRSNLPLLTYSFPYPCTEAYLLVPSMTRETAAEWVWKAIHWLKWARGLVLISTSLLGFCLTWTTGYWREEKQMAWYR